MDRELKIGRYNLRVDKDFTVVSKQEMMGRNRGTILTKPELLEARIDRF